MWVAANCSKLLCLASLSTSNSYSLLCFRSSFAKAGVRKPSCVEQSHREVYSCSCAAMDHSSSNQHTELAVRLFCASAPFPGHIAPHLVWEWCSGTLTQTSISQGARTLGAPPAAGGTCWGPRPAASGSVLFPAVRDERLMGQCPLLHPFLWFSRTLSFCPP